MKQGAPETKTTTTPIENQEEKVEVKYRQTYKCTSFTHLSFTNFKFQFQKQLAEGQTESDDEDFAADTQEIEDAVESSSESKGGEEGEKEDSVVDEDYMVQINGRQIQKMKFAQMDQESQKVRLCSDLQF